MRINHISKLACLLLILIAGIPAVKADTVTADFNSGSLPEGWEIVGNLTINSDRANGKNGNGVWTSQKADKTNYIITTPIVGDISFYARTYNTKSPGYITFYEVSEDNKPGDKIVEFNTGNTSSGQISFKKYTYNLEVGRRIIIDFNYACLDDFTYTEAVVAAGPSLAVDDFASESTYNFGGVPVKEGTEKIFQLRNTGSQDLNISSITVTGGYEIAEGGDPRVIPVSGSASLTIKTPAETTSGVLTINSDDDNSPYIIYLESQYKAPAPIMTVDVASIDFGKVVESAERTITIGNEGDAVLNVTIESNSDSFTVNPASLSVQPEETAEVTVAFNYSDQDFGAHSGVVILTPESGDAVEINVDAFAKDPTLWEEDFEGGAIPQYWSTNGWTVSNIATYSGGNGTYMAYAGTSYTPPTLTTPRLRAAKDEVLTFQVGGGTDGTDKMTVEYSHDQQTWIELDGSPFTTHGYKEFIAPEEGFYYLRFCGRYGAVDNFSGFRLALKEHDLSITRQTIPAAATQHSPYTATVTVKEMMGKEEIAVASLYVNEEKVASLDDITIGANEEKTITLSYTPLAPAEEAMTYIEVIYSGETLNTEAVAVTIAPAFTLDENEAPDSELENKTLESLVFKYTTVNGWNTIATPFALTDEILESIFGEGYEVFEFTEMQGSEMIFRAPTYFSAGYPYLVKAVNADETADEIILNNIRISAVTPNSDTRGGVTFNGTFAPVMAADASIPYYIAESYPSLKPVGEDGKGLSGYRGYVTLSENVSKVPGVVVYTKDGVLTGVPSLTPDNEGNSGIFNLNGQKVSEPGDHGIYIINGKKILK